MASIKVEINRQILDWVIMQARESALPPKSMGLLEDWRNGSKTPTFSQIETVSRETRIPFGYFFLKTPPEEKVPLLEFRTIKSAGNEKPSRDLLDTINDMENIVDWTRENLISEGIEENSLVGKLKGETRKEPICSFIRSALCLKSDWFSETSSSAKAFERLRSAMNDAGIIVMKNGIVGNNTKRVLDVEEFRAFSMADSYAPLIFINNSDSENGKLFSLLHEFTHVCLGEDSLFNDGNQMGSKVSPLETLCNSVSAEILVPRTLFLKKWEEYEKAEGSGHRIFESLANYFNCGQVVIARKALEERLIGTQEYQKLAAQAKANYYSSRKNRSGGGNYYTTLKSKIDSRFFSLLLESVASGRTLYTEAFRLTNTNRRSFDRLEEIMAGNG